MKEQAQRWTTAPTVKSYHKIEPSAQPLLVSEHEILLARPRRAVPPYIQHLMQN